MAGKPPPKRKPGESAEAARRRLGLSRWGHGVPHPWGGGPTAEENKIRRDADEETAAELRRRRGKK